MKLDWKDAPGWALWLAQDEDGDWYWYENEPDRSSSGWTVRRVGGACSKAPIEVSGWKNHLEARP